MAEYLHCPPEATRTLLLGCHCSVAQSGPTLCDPWTAAVPQYKIKSLKFWGGETREMYFFMVGGWKSEIRVQVRSGPGESCLPGVQIATFSLILTWFSLSLPLLRRLPILLD